MKKWLVRLSVTLNVLVLMAALGVWFNRNAIIGLVLDQMYAAKVSFFEAYPVDGRHVVMLGDSITEGGEWAEMFPGLPIVNRGIPGDTTTGVLARLDSIVDARPAAIFLKIGTNDLTMVPEREVSHQQYRQILNTIQTISPDTRIYVQSLLPRAIDMRAEVEAYNREIRAMANELGVTYIDLYPEFLAADGSIRDELTYDELHLTGEGYHVWQSLLEPRMSEYQVQ